MILLCLTGILLSLGLTFEADFTRFPEPGISAAVLHQAHLILCWSHPDLTAGAGAQCLGFALQGGSPELMAEELSPRIAGESGLSHKTVMTGLWEDSKTCGLQEGQQTALCTLILEASMTPSLRRLPHPPFCHLHETVNCSLSWQQIPAGKQMDLRFPFFPQVPN